MGAPLKSKAPLFTSSAHGVGRGGRAEAAAVAAFAPTLPDSHQSHRHRVVPSSPWHSRARR